MKELEIKGKIYKIPEKWEEITLKQFKEISKHLDEKSEIRFMVSMLSIVSKPQINEDIIKKFSKSSLDETSKHLMFLLEKAPEVKLKDRIEINGTIFAPHPNLDELTVGEFVDLEFALKDNENRLNNTDKIVSIVCREVDKEYEEYGNKKYTLVEYDSDLARGRADLFLNNMAITDVFSILSFFFASGTKYSMSIENYLKVMKKKVQESLEKAGDG